MKILMLTPYLPYPPSSGGQVRSYNLLKHLGKKHDVTLVALIKKSEEEKYVSHLKAFCKSIFVCKRSESPWTAQNILKSIFGRDPFLVVRNFSPEAKQKVHQLLETQEFDLIHAETFYIMPHIPKTKKPIFLVEQTIEFMVYQHFVDNLKWPFIKPFFIFDILKLKSWEKTYWKKADLVGAMSETDKDKMLSLLPDLRVEIIPNAAGEDLENLYTAEKKVQKPVFLYQGNFSWLQNTEAAKHLITTIFPAIQKKIPGAICIVAGQRAKEKIGHLKKKGIEIVDIKPDDIELVKNLYRKASIFIAPIEGPGGTRLKILGAMAAGLPVISSKTGVSGLEVSHMNTVLIANSPTEFATLSHKILTDKKMYNTIRANAKNVVEEKYNWKRVAEKLEQIYLRLIHDKNRN